MFRLTVLSTNGVPYVKAEGKERSAGNDRPPPCRLDSVRGRKGRCPGRGGRRRLPTPCFPPDPAFRGGGAPGAGHSVRHAETRLARWSSVTARGSRTGRWTPPSPQEPLASRRSRNVAPPVVAAAAATACSRRSWKPPLPSGKRSPHRQLDQRRSRGRRRDRLRSNSMVMHAG
jgi:hypothetical protein